jgi:hypothetical protein
MLDRANAGVPIGQLAGIGFRVRDQLLEVLSWQRGMHSNAQNIGGDSGNRLQILDGIIERLALEPRLVDMRLRPAEQDRVAIRARTCRNEGKIGIMIVRGGSESS